MTEFKVDRIRYSVTQGEAAVYYNGEKLIQYADDIKFKHHKQYGEIINGWASSRDYDLFIQSAKIDCKYLINRINKNKIKDGF